MLTPSLPTPAELVFYEKPGCLSNARQKVVLVGLGHCLEVRNILREHWSPERLRPFFGTRPVTEWFNPTAPRVRSGEVRPDLLGEGQALALMVADPLLIRRPLIQVRLQEEARCGCGCGFEPGPLLESLGVEFEEGEDLQSCSRGGAEPTCPEVPMPLSLGSAGARPRGDW